MTKVLELESVMAGYGDVPVLWGVSAYVERNETVAIVGANGAGKTTVVRAVCGLVRAWDGRITKNGVNIAGMSPPERVAQGIAVVLEGRHLFGELSIRDNLTLAVSCSQRNGRASASMDEVLTLFPFMRQRLATPVHVLSGGEQQMVAIARALLLEPDVLIMDEPSTGLAPKVVEEIVSVLTTLKAKGMSLILVEQNLALAAKVSDRAYVMAGGKVVHEVRSGEWSAFLSEPLAVHAYLGGLGG